MIFYGSPASPRQRATGVIASVVAEAKSNGPIGYSQNFADRIVEALEVKGFVIVEKAVQS